MKHTRRKGFWNKSKGSRNKSKGSRDKKGGMRRTISRAITHFQEPDSRAYTAVKDFFAPGGHSNIETLDELIDAVGEMPPSYRSSTGKTYWSWLTLDNVFTKHKNTNAINGDTMQTLLRLLYSAMPYESTSGDMYLLIFFGIIQRVGRELCLTLCNRLVIENDICYITFTNKDTELQDRVSIESIFPGRANSLYMYQKLLTYLDLSLRGTLREKAIIIGSIIDQIVGLDETRKAELHYIFGGRNRFVEGREEQHMDPNRGRINIREALLPLARRPVAQTPVAQEIPEECPLCMEPMKNNKDHPTIVNSLCPNNHVFHGDCLTNWCQRLSTHDKRTRGCPICRGAISDSCQFRQIVVGGVPMRYTIHNKPLTSVFTKPVTQVQDRSQQFVEALLERANPEVIESLLSNPRKPLYLAIKNDRRFDTFRTDISIIEHIQQMLAHERDMGQTNKEYKYLMKIKDRLMQSLSHEPAEEFMLEGLN